MEIEIIKGIQSGANALVDDFFLFITNIGSKLFFIAVFCLLFWCYNKRYALNFAIGCGLASLLNSGLKSIFNRPRPYMLSDKIVNYTNTSGGSFPSGHSCSIGVISSLLTCEIYKNKDKNKRWFRITSIIILVLASLLVGLSRMYLGQHFLSDVLVGLVVGWGVGYIASKFLFITNDKEHIYALYLLPVLFAALFLYVDKMFTSNLSPKTVYYLIGIATSIIIGYYFEKKYVKFEVKANWLFNVFKAGFGFLTVVGLNYLLDWVFPKILIFEFIKAFLIGLYISLGIMVFFKWFAKVLKITYIPNKTAKADNVEIEKVDNSKLENSAQICIDTDNKKNKTKVNAKTKQQSSVKVKETVSCQTKVKKKTTSQTKVKKSISKN